MDHIIYRDCIVYLRSFISCGLACRAMRLSLVNVTVVTPRGGTRELWSLLAEDTGQTTVNRSEVSF